MAFEGIRNFFSQGVVIATEDVAISTAPSTNPTATTGKALVVAVGSWLSSVAAIVVGKDAHDAALTAAPVTTGGYASATAPAAVTAADAVRDWRSLSGATIIGAQYSSTLAAITATQVGTLQVSDRGILRSFLHASSQAGADAVSNSNLLSVTGPASDSSSSSQPLQIANTVYNGSTWDRQRGDATNGTWVSGAFDHDAALGTTKPVIFGGKARNAAPVQVAQGDAVQLWVTDEGSIITAAQNVIGQDGISNSNMAWTRMTNNANSYLMVAPTVFNGTTWDRVRGDVNHTAVGRGLSSNSWTYAAATGGIDNTTTAVTLKAAVASVRNVITSLQIDWESLGTATEIAIRDGAGGTVLWRGHLPSGAAGRREISFENALKGTANTLLEFVTLTATTTGKVYVNAQGHTQV